MPKPVIGILANATMIDADYPAYSVGRHNVEAIAELVGGTPIMIPGDPDLADPAHMIEICDGFVLPGGRPNVHPSEYGHAETEAHGGFDRGRDGTALALIRSCVARGQPILGICRGFQEMAVAFGATLHPEIRDLDGRDNHRMPPDGTVDEKFALRHDVTLTEDGPFAHIFGAATVRTNSLHGQGILDPGPRVVIDGTASDGTPEAIYIRDAKGFALGVQWHPEYQAAQDPVSRPLYQAFAQACRDWATRERP